jgi:ankyrin repeat protein
MNLDAEAIVVLCREGDIDGIKSSILRFGGEAVVGAKTEIKTETVPAGTTGLHAAAKAGKTQMIAFLLENGADPDAEDAIDCSPLELAIWEGHVEAIRLLTVKVTDLSVDAIIRLCTEGDVDGIKSLMLEFGAEAVVRAKTDTSNFYHTTKPDIEENYEGGTTGLHAAAEAGKTQMVSFLLENGADPDAENALHQSPLALAVEKGHVDAKQLLMEKAKTPNPSAVIALCVEGDASAIESLIQKFGQGVVVGSRATRRAYDQYTPLHLAVEKDHLVITQLLLDNGADVNAVSLYQKTPLHCWADENGNPLIARLLIDNGAVNARNSDQHTHLDLPTRSCDGHLAVVLLLNNGADIRGGGSWPPLHRASSDGHFDVVRLLLDSGADVNAISLYQKMPLHCAAENSQPAVARLLIESGAAVDARDSTSEHFRNFYRRI